LTCASDARHEKLPGYDPLLCFVAETGTVLNGRFRPGNAEPSGNALSFLRSALKRIPPWVRNISLRSDSAWYNHRVMDYRHNRGIHFSIAAVLTGPLLEAARAIPEGAWRYLDKADYVIMTNITDWTPAQVARRHRRRATAENIIKELKRGFGLGRLPCGELLANAAYFEANLPAYNLVQLYKRLVLPAD